MITTTGSAIADHRSYVPAAALFATPLPRSLRPDAESCSWAEFRTRHGVGGPIRLGSWSSTPSRDDLHDFCATIAVGSRISALTETATGPLGAATAMLASLDVAIEIVGLHQQQIGAETLTLIRGRRGRETAWGLGCAPTAAASNVAALIAAANRL